MGWGTDIDLEDFKLSPFLEFKARRDTDLILLAGKQSYADLTTKPEMVFARGKLFRC